VNKRYAELDSLRGIAAMLVFLFHIAMVLPDSWREGLLWNALNYSPFHIALSGKIHVIFFFILSGFVLSLPYFYRKENSYLSFIIKRFCRLYFPYAAAISLAIVACYSFSLGGIKELGGLFNSVWVEDKSAGIIVQHFLFLGNYNVFAFNIVIWSLIHEMRISFIFPFLMILGVRFGWKINLAVGVFLGVIGGGIHLFLQEPYQPLYKSFFYILMFIVGILLAKNRDYLTEKFKSLTKTSRVMIFLFGTALYIYSDVVSNPPIADWITTLGVSILIIISISSELLSKILLWRPFQFLGKISYSLYLYHLPILLSLVYLFFDKVPLWIILGASVIITLTFSNMAWHLIEKPSIRIAKRISIEILHKADPLILAKDKKPEI
jgi:peptidoglycan/LPS O-acetylase OafA/YrhL